MFPSPTKPKFDREIDDMIGPEALATDFLVATTGLMRTAKKHQR